MCVRSKQINDLIDIFFFFFSFAYTTSPVAVMKSSSGPSSPHIISGEAELLMTTVRFALVGACYISEEHAHWYVIDVMGYWLSLTYVYIMMFPTVRT